MLDVFYVEQRVVLILLLKREELQVLTTDFVQQFTKRMVILMGIKTANKFACALPPRLKPWASMA